VERAPTPGPEITDIQNTATNKMNPIVFLFEVCDGRFGEWIYEQTSLLCSGTPDPIGLRYVGRIIGLLMYEGTNIRLANFGRQCAYKYLLN
jgi:hypothetical protein